MEFLMTRRALVIALLVLPLMVGGCGRRFRLNQEQLEQPSTWPFIRGTAAGPGAIESTEWTGRLDVVWSVRVSDRPAGPLTLGHGVLIYPGVRRRIRFYDQSSGAYLGRWQAKRPAQTGVSLLDSLAFYGTTLPYYRLCCVDLSRRHRVWQGSVKDAAAGTIIVQDRLVVASSAGTLEAFNAYTGEPVWSLEAPGRLVAGPSGDVDRVYQPVANGAVIAAAASDGRELFRVELNEPIPAGVAVGGFVFVAAMPGDVFALDRLDGHTVWRTSVGGEVWAAPAVAEGRVFVGLATGELVALDAATGSELWRYRTVEVVRAAPVAVGRFVVVGTMTGKLLSLDAATGSVVDQHQLDGAIATAPVSNGRQLFVATEEGDILSLGDVNEEVSRFQRSNPGHRSQRTGPLPDPGSGHGLSQGGHIRLRPSDGGTGAGETVLRLRVDLPL